MESTGNCAGSMRLRDVQRMLNVNRSTLQDLIKSGDLPVEKVGTEWRISEKNLTNWLKREVRPEITMADRSVFESVASVSAAFINDWT